MASLFAISLFLGACGGSGGDAGFTLSQVTSLPETVDTNERIENVDFQLAGIYYDETTNDGVKINLSSNGDQIKITSQFGSDIDSWVGTRKDSNVFTMDRQYTYALSDYKATQIASVLGYMNYYGFDIDVNHEIKNISDIMEAQEKLLNTACAQNSCTAEQINQIRVILADLSTHDLRQTEYTDEDITANSFGAQAGLKYSDFGYIKYQDTTYRGVATESDEGAQVFFGGYRTKAAERPTTYAVYNGTAIANVDRVEYFNNDNYAHNYLVSKTDDASLIVSGNSETLKMNFANATENPWYNVTVTKNLWDTPYDTTRFAIDTHTNTEIPQDFSLNADVITEGSMHTKYYGDNNFAEESISTASTSFDIDDNAWMQIQTAFGGTR